MSMSMAEFQARVEEKAATLKPGRALLTVIAAVLFAVGWLVGQAVRFVWTMIAWAWAASVVGFHTARHGDGGD